MSIFIVISGFSFDEIIKEDELEFETKPNLVFIIFHLLVNGGVKLQIFHGLFDFFIKNIFNGTILISD